MFRCSCRLSSPTFYYAFFAPVVLVLLINSSLLIKCIWFVRVTYQRQSASVGVTRRNSHRQAQGLLGIALLVGVTWLVGIPMFDEARLPFQYSFAVLNSLQGLAIFVFHFASNEKIRNSWIMAASKATLPMRAKIGDIGSRLTSLTRSEKSKQTLPSETRDTLLCSPELSLPTVGIDTAAPQSFSSAANQEDGILY